MWRDFVHAICFLLIGLFGIQRLFVVDLDGKLEILVSCDVM
jgi:hypothetical protein